MRKGVGSNCLNRGLRGFVKDAGAVRNADRMNQRRVRVLPRSESRRGVYAAKLRKQSADPFQHGNRRRNME